MKKLIFGYTTKNYGDDLLIDSYLQLEKEKKTNSQYYLFDVLPEFNSNVFEQRGVNIINKTFYKRVLKKFSLLRKLYINRLAKQFDELIVIGGSMFIENRENKELFELIEGFINTDKKVDVMGANFGPYETNDFLLKYDNLFKRCNKVVFRDYKSKRLFKSDNIFVSTDLALSIDHKFRNINENVVGIVPVSLSIRPNLISYKNEYFDCLTELIDRFISEGRKVELFGFCEFEKDNEIITDLQERYPDLASHIYNGDLDDFSESLSKCGTIVSSRFHGIVFAIQNESKALSISYSGKTKELLTDLEIDIKDIDISNLINVNIEDYFNSIQNTGKYTLIDKNIFAPYK